MNIPQTPPPQPTFSERVARFFRVLLRLIVAIVLGIALGIGLYYGFPALYNRFILPVEENTLRITELEAKQEQTYNQVTERLDELQSRLDALIVLSDQEKETLATFQAQLAEVDSRYQALLDEQTNTLERLNTLEAELEQWQTDTEAIATKTAGLAETVSANQDNVETLQEALIGQDTPLTALRRELQMVKAMELLTRSRMYLLNKNIGLAETDIRSARDLLIGLQVEAPAAQALAIQPIIDRLNMALANLVAAPLLVDQDLEVAWQLLMRGIPSETELKSQPLTGTQAIVEATITPLGSAQGTPPLTLSPLPSPIRTATPTP